MVLNMLDEAQKCCSSQLRKKEEQGSESMRLSFLDFSNKAVGRTSYDACRDPYLFAKHLFYHSGFRTKRNLQFLFQTLHRSISFRGVVITQQ